jgi:hypothetical protein
MGRGPLKRQMGVALDPKLRARLEAASVTAGHSVASEIRRRLEQSFEAEGLDLPTRRLMAAIGELAVLVRLQTNHAWHSHPAANRVFRHALTARLARLKPSGEPVFAPNELPTVRLVAAGSDDPEAMGLALEAVEFHTTDGRKDRQQEDKGEKS